MNRRNFVLFAGAGLSTIALGTWYLRQGVHEIDPLLREPEILSYIWDAETIGRIGISYRSQFPRENTEKLLAQEFDKFDQDGPDRIFEQYRQLISTEYRTGKTVMVDGWILSVTEARQCAIFKPEDPLLDAY